MRYRAVIFDMDGTLIDSEPLWQHAEITVFQSLGLPVTHEDCKKTIGMRIDQVVQYWHQRSPWQGSALEEVEEMIMEEVQAQIRRKGEAKKGVYEAITYLSDSGYPLAIASSSYPSVIEATLNKLELSMYFSVVHSAQCEKHGKPDPAVYLSTARKLGINPKDCLAFEDSLNGIRSAKAAGMTCVAMKEDHTSFDEARAIADYSLESFVELSAAEWLSE